MAIRTLLAILSLSLQLTLTLAAPAKHDVPLTRRGGSTNSTTGRLNQNYTQDFLNQLELATGTVDRLTLLKNAGDPNDFFKFDFSVAANPNPVAGVGMGGQGDLAYVKNFPVLMGLGVAMSMGFLNPCGMNTPHTHNRATEFLTIVAGGNVRTSFIQESGLTDPIETTLSLYQGAVFPIGSLHYEFNDNCEPAIFAAAFSNEDPGLSRAAQNFFLQDAGIVDADLGFPEFLDGVDIPKFEKMIPKPFALGAKECLKRCNITYTT